MGPKTASVDYHSLDQKLNAKPSYKLSQVQDKLRKVAFDVVKFESSENIPGLWQIQQDSQGEYIVAMYEEPQVPAIKTASDWQVLTDGNKSSISVFYRHTPMVRLAAQRLGVNSQELSSLAADLPEQLSANPQLVRGLLAEMPAAERASMVSTFPELLK